ncbi:hypothetical protein RYT60_000649 [Salmonella enterica]|nr:hypothetical protein [Salmonella enterica]ELM3071032.1 hypothetical protein [Salmonella enterica]
MTFEEELQRSLLAYILKAKNLKTQEEWLDHHICNSTFGEYTGAYDHFINQPRYDIGVVFLPDIICIKTINSFFPEKFKKDCFEIVLLDTQQRKVLYYLLCIPTLYGVCPISWRIGFYDKEQYLHDIDIIILQNVLMYYNLCIDYRNKYGDNMYYWSGIIRILAKKGFNVYECKDKDVYEMIPQDLLPSFIGRISDASVSFVVGNL